MKRVDVSTLCLLLLCLAVGACTSKYEDVTSQPEYAGMRDRVYVLSEDAVIHGVTLAKDYKGPVDHYVVTEKPGFAGPEVLSKHPLPRGTVMVVVQVLQCVNCFPRTTDVSLAIGSEPNDAGRPILMDLDSLKTYATPSVR